jgi:ribonuclease HII
MPTFALERAHLKKGISPVAGVDEAGRGPLAGPVLAAAIILPLRGIPRGIDDSKALSPERREAIYEKLRACAEIGLGAASVAEITRLNILNATLLAMRRAVLALARVPALALIDGDRAPELPCASLTVVRGDATVLSIAAASIVAKVTRDRIMRALGRRWPDYGFERHMGYATEAHRAVLARLGPTPHHRPDFHGVHNI